jgi:L-ribulose-5-phosphate 4-epimerase
MTVDEGYTKFKVDWTPGPAPDHSLTDLLDIWRKPLHEAGLIGHYADLGIGFGNISVRFSEPGQFVISGTQTGHLAETGSEHYALVTSYDIAGNHVSCTGPVQASSESLTHAAIYELDPGINAVVHVHSMQLWNKLLDRVPTTGPDIAYGTPEMAYELVRLYQSSEFADSGVAVMAGHEEGIISIGGTLEQAVLQILQTSRNN